MLFHWQKYHLSFLVTNWLDTVDALSTSLDLLKLKKKLKQLVHEDPTTDNYRVHKNKYVLPLLNRSNKVSENIFGLSDSESA